MQSLPLSPNRWRVLAIVSVALLLITVDATVLYAALPRLTHALHADASAKLWIINAYPLAVTGLLPGAGALSDRFGAKRMFVSGLIVFGLASACVAFSPTAAWLIANRVLLALGAAMMMPATLSLLRHAFTDARERALAIGVWAAIAAGGAALGPVVGGILLEFFWWGSVFLINVPIVLLLLWPATRIAEADAGHAMRPFDPVGSVLILIGMVGVVYAIKEFSMPQPWYAGASVAALLGVVFCGVFVRRQRRSARPMIDFGLFRLPAFRQGVLVALVASSTLVGMELVLSQRLQLVMGMSPLHAALYLLPVPAAAAVSGPLAGLMIGRAGQQTVMRAALLTAGLGMAGTALLHAHSPMTQVIALSVLGLGLGAAITAASNAVMGSAPVESAGMAASIEEVSYEMGHVLGVTLLGSLLTAVYARTLVTPAALQADAAVRDSLDQALEMASRLDAGTGAELVRLAHGAFDHAYVIVVAVAAAVLLLTALGLRGRSRAMRPG
ncbi:MFS transporter [Bordetella genomosp. 5]|uniref:MFS transporter n=1 Tax=Bordetella genomosp. 5 TaxID=1395608 RepID=A0A261TJA2_9BORD|nr:MFS transporter [Bordetella genomosp. 5]OZI49110.1 MFS transporter [Bordetella genomosp. 5]